MNGPLPAKCFVPYRQYLLLRKDFGAFVNIVEPYVQYMTEKKQLDLAYFIGNTKLFL